MSETQSQKEEPTATTAQQPPSPPTTITILDDDEALGVVRIKPLGAGGGGVESSATSNPSGALRWGPPHGRGVHVQQRHFAYPGRVVTPETDQQALFDEFMPQRIEGFLEGYDANIIAYGQTGSGKTHTMFGPPGIMQRAGDGEYGVDNPDCADYGLFPRGMWEIFRRLEERREGDSAKGISYVLTASAVELCLTGNVDMMVKAAQSSKRNLTWNKGSGMLGVCIDKTARPPRLYGMTELVVTEPADLLVVFSAIASRNTVGTNMNDSSSRSHCFVFLTLFAYHRDSATVRKSRFQFVDLAGSEKIDEAHGDDARHWTSDNIEMINGMMTNYALSMLSSAVRNLIEHRRKNRARKARGEKQTKFSFRSYLFDLVLLLQCSLTGSAMTAIIVCVSQAIDNASQTKFALEFGEQFSKLHHRKNKAPVEPVEKIRKRALKVLAESEAVLGKKKQINEKSTDKFTIIRNALVRDSKHILEVLTQLESTDAESVGSGDGKSVKA